MSSNGKIIVTAVVPFLVFLAAFAFLGGFFRIAAACDCFFNYRDLVFSIMSFVFLFGLSFMVHLIKKNGREYKFIHTVVIGVLFLVVYFAIMLVGEFFYVPEPFFKP